MPQPAWMNHDKTTSLQFLVGGKFSVSPRGLMLSRLAWHAYSHQRSETMGLRLLSRFLVFFLLGGRHLKANEASCLCEDSQEFLCQDKWELIMLFWGDGKTLWSAITSHLRRHVFVKTSMRHVETRAISTRGGGNLAEPISYLRVYFFLLFLKFVILVHLLEHVQNLDSKCIWP